VERAAALAPVNVFPIGAITKGDAGRRACRHRRHEGGRSGPPFSDDGLPGDERSRHAPRHGVRRSYDLPIIQHCEDLT